MIIRVKCIKHEKVNENQICDFSNEFVDLAEYEQRKKYGAQLPGENGERYKSCLL